LSERLADRREGERPGGGRLDREGGRAGEREVSSRRRQVWGGGRGVRETTGKGVSRGQRSGGVRDEGFWLGRKVNPEKE
jgi:hypothetical protein